MTVSRQSVARTLPRGLAPIVEQLEMDRAEFVTTADIAVIATQAGLSTPASVLASRLKARGWLLPTATRGIYEFSPGSHGGAVSRGTATLPLRALLTATPLDAVGLTLQSAAWAHGLADRNPLRLEVAAPDSALAVRVARALGSRARVVVFRPVLEWQHLRGVPVLAVESVLVSMARRPSDVRAWASTLEWLPDLAASCSPELVQRELRDRPSSVRTRLAYLVSGLRPRLSESLCTPAARDLGPVYFGPRGPSLRFDGARQVADTILPFDPRTLQSVES